MFIPNGVYRLGRDPMYLGMTLILPGVAIAGWSPFGFVVPLVFLLVVDRAHIPMEERWMGETFGRSHLDCRARVRRRL